MSSDIETRITEWFSAQPGFGDYELAGLTVRRQGKRSFVEILLDRRSGRITLDECGRWNRMLSAHLEQADLFAGPYLVEISSPGIDRPLAAPRDYARVIGRLLRVSYKDASGSVLETVGRLERVDEREIALAANGQELLLPYPNIVRARQEVIFSKETN